MVVNMSCYSQAINVTDPYNIDVRIQEAVKMVVNMSYYSEAVELLTIRIRKLNICADPGDCKSQPPGEPREHHLGLQGSSKFKFNITLYYLIGLLGFRCAR